MFVLGLTLFKTVTKKLYFYPKWIFKLVRNKKEQI